MQSRLLAFAVGAVLFAGCSKDAPSNRQPPNVRGNPVAGGPGAAGTTPATDGSTFGNAPKTVGTGGATAGAAAMRPSGMAGAGGKCGAVTQMAENTLQPVDIIFGVDTTGSMGEEIAFTEENMNAFSEQIIDAGIDVRVVMVSTLKDGMPLIPVHLDGVCIAAPLGSGSCPADSSPPRYVHINQANTDGDLLQNFINVYPMYKQYLRENSFKTFVSISDGNIGENPVFLQPIYDAATFTAAVDGLEPNSPMWRDWRFSAIYSFSACGIGNSEGTVYADLVNRTHGVGGDLCLQNFKPVFDDLAKQVMDVVTLACDWAIPPPPRGETFDRGKTNVQLTLDGNAEQLGKAASAADCGTRDGWRYDDDAAPQRVVACPSTCTRIQAARNAQVDLLFGCETVALPPVE